MSLKKLPKFKQPREKLVNNGSENVSDVELLAIMLRSGSKYSNVLQLSSKILGNKGISGIMQYTYESLKALKGVGPVHATTILAMQEICCRISEQDVNPVIQSVHDVYTMISSLKYKKREHFLAIYLNARQQLITKQIISIGTLDSSIAHPRDVFAPALQHNAAHVIIAHNHPSGDPDPSHADVLLTKRMYHAGKILGVDLIDHIIIAQKGIVSLKELQII